MVHHPRDEIILRACLYWRTGADKILTRPSSGQSLVQISLDTVPPTHSLAWPVSWLTTIIQHGSPWGQMIASQPAQPVQLLTSVEEITSCIDFVQLQGNFYGFIPSNSV